MQLTVLNSSAARLIFLVQKWTILLYSQEVLSIYDIYRYNWFIRIPHIINLYNVRIRNLVFTDRFHTDIKTVMRFIFIPKCWSSGINEHFCYIYWKRFLFVGSTDTIDLHRYRISPIHLIATAVIAFMTTGFSTVMPTYAGAVAFTASSYYRNVERGDSDDEWGIVGDLYHFFPHDADPAVDLENEAPSSAVRYRKPVFFPFHLYLFALAEREWFIIFCHAMCMIEELCYITQNWTETIK